MIKKITISRREVVALIEEAAQKLTQGNKTEAVKLGMRHLLEETARTGTLFGAHPGSVRVSEGVNLVAPSMDLAFAATRDKTPMQKTRSPRKH
jgi:hypothetical protein